MPKRKKEVNYKDLNDGVFENRAAEMTALQDEENVLACEEEIVKLWLQVEQQRTAIKTPQFSTSISIGADHEPAE